MPNLKRPKWMSTKRQPKVSTLRQSVSHLKKQIARLKNMQLTVPPPNYKTPVIKALGSTITVDGVRYGAKDLEALKGTKAAWQVPALQQLEERLAMEEYRLAAIGKAPRKLSALTELEASHAKAGLAPITTLDEIEFHNWINRGSDGIKKAYYYHEYGADRINRGHIRGFMQWMAMESGEQIEKVSDLYGLFSD